MSKDTEAAGYMELLKYSLDYFRGDLEVMSSLGASYANRIDPSIWPCQAQIPTGQAFIAVEEALPAAMDMCFPETNGLQLVPTGQNTNEEQWRNAEWALWTMAHYRMRLRDKALRSLKDVFKMSVGYGIVDTFTHFPDVPAEISVGSKSTTIMTRGEAQRSIRYRYISPGKIIPYTSGTDFNGDDATPLSFFLDSFPKWQLEKMMEQDKQDNGDKSRFKASMKEIEEAATKYLSVGSSDFFEFSDALGGSAGAQDRKRNGLPDHAPMDIPVIRVFEQPGKEIWIVPSSTSDGIVLMKQEASELVRLRNPLVKWTAWPDGDLWFPTSAPEIDQKRGFAYDLYINFMFDMMSRTKDARLVVDKTALGPDQRHLDLTGDIYIEGGDARTAATYLENPRMDPNILSVGSELNSLGQQIQGRQNFTEKNFTRGGTQAFADLLGTMQARQRLSATILETGALTNIYQHILAHMQDTISQDESMVLSRNMYEAGSGTRHIESRTITSADLMHGYELVLDTSERRMLGGMSDRQRLQIWQLLQDRDDVRPAEVNRIIPLPDTTIHRLFKTRKEQEAIQEENRATAQASQLAGVAGSLAAGQAAEQEVGAGEAGV